MMQSDPQPDPLAARVMSLEEHAGFAERTVEVLSQEVRVLNQTVQNLTRRLASLEARVGGVVERLEKPPGGEDGGAAAGSGQQ